MYFCHIPTYLCIPVAARGNWQGLGTWGPAACALPLLQDPYCVLTCGNIKLLSSVHKRKYIGENLIYLPPPTHHPTLGCNPAV